MACEKCWADAYLRAMSHPEKTQAEHYHDLLEERKENPCPPMSPCSNCGHLSGILILGRCVACAEEWAEEHGQWPVVKPKQESTL